MNMAILIGHLADEPKMAQTKSGISKCTFRLATNREYANAQTGKREADFHNIVAWRNLADICGKYLKKGHQCMVSGSIQYRSYEAQDGSKRYMTEIIAEKVKFLERRPRAGGEQQGNMPIGDGEYTEIINDDDLPF